MSDKKVLLTYKRKRVSATSSLPHEDGPHYPHLKEPPVTLPITSDKSQDSNINDASAEQIDENVGEEQGGVKTVSSYKLPLPNIPHQEALVKDHLSTSLNAEKESSQSVPLVQQDYEHPVGSNMLKTSSLQADTVVFPLSLNGEMKCPIQVLTYCRRLKRRETKEEVHVIVGKSSPDTIKSTDVKCGIGSILCTCKGVCQCSLGGDATASAPSKCETDDVRVEIQKHNSFSIQSTFLA